MASTIKLKNGSGAPLAADLVQGEPALDLTNKRLYTEDSLGAVIEIGTNPTSITTGNITATGTINLSGATVSNLGTVTTVDINGGTIDGVTIGGASAGAITGTTITGTSFVSSGNMTFGDNDKAIFGAGSDLEIYHDGSYSYIKDAGTGDLRIQGSTNVQIWNSSLDKQAANFNAAGGQTLYYDNAAKLATTNTGIDVTGTVTADGLTVDGTNNVAIITTNQSNYTEGLTLRNTANWGYGTSLSFEAIPSSGGSNTEVGRLQSTWISTGYHGLDFYVLNNNSLLRQMRIAGNGDISFYEDTGTTPKLFWDASAESLGIGTSSVPAGRSLAIAGGSVRIDNDQQIEWGGSTAGLYGNGSTDSLTFFTATTTRMTLDSSGNLGLGVTPSTGWASTWKAMQIGTGGVVFGRVSSASPEDEVLLGANLYNDGAWKYSNTGYATFYHQNTGQHQWYTAPSGTAGNAITFTQAMTLDASGNLLVGTTTVNPGIGNTATGVMAGGSILSASRSGNVPAFFNRNTSDGDIAQFLKDGVAVGSIGAATLAGATNLIIDAPNAVYFGTNARPETDDLYDIGSASYRWDDIYATNGTIQTSDRNEKQDIEELSDAEQRVAVAAKGLLRKFRWKSKVEEKGDDARIHFGIIAQDLQAAFEAEGLDAGRYAMFIHTTWTDEETGEERSRMGVRYSELLAFIIAAI